MYSRKDILEGARTIRPFLKELVGESAEDLDNTLAAMLEAAQNGEQVENILLNALAEQAATREWMRKFLERSRRLTTTRGYNPLPGRPSTPGLKKYVCPNKDYVWYRQSVSTPVPTCPTHHTQLVPAQQP